MMNTLYEALILGLLDLIFFAALAAGLILLGIWRSAAFAVLKRNFVGYFINPTGYVFLCLFVLLTSCSAFCPDEFFNSNLANLDQLNKYIPYILLIFIPAITMSIWAEERRQGTDELLLTLPATDFDIVMGKFLAAASIFTVSLVFSQFSHFAVLAALTEGDLDTRLLCATYLGYWFVGISMLSLGMVASFLTNNLTVGFILGALFNAPLALAASADLVLPSSVARGVARWSFSQQFADFGRGIVSLSSTTYFLMVTLVGLYLSMVLIGRRHWSGGRDGNSLLGHFALRTVALLVIAMGLNVLFVNHDQRADATQTKVNSLSPDTYRILSDLDSKRPIVINAFVGSEIPEDYVKTRVELLSMLREFQAASGGKVQVRIQEDVEPTSDAAVQAEKRFGIRPQIVRSQARGVFKDVPVILGAAVTCGLEKVVIPFFDYGIPVEYELIRSISTASKGQRKRLGVVRTDAQLLGGFSFAGGQPQNIPKSAFVEELEKQYDVEEVDPQNKIEPGKFDVLLVVQPSSMGPQELENLNEVVRRGQPTAIFEDPLPLMGEMRLVPGTGQPKRQNPMAQMFGGGPPPPKGDITRLWQTLGIECIGERGSAPPTGGPPMYDSFIVWQRFNPYKKIQAVAGFSSEFVFVRPEVPGDEEPFNASDAVSNGIEELLFPMPGAVTKAKDSDVDFVALVQTGNRAGTISFQNWQANQQDTQALELAEGPTRGKFVIAARIKGKEKGESKEADKAEGEKKDWTDKPLNVIYVSDIDLISSDFVRIRAQPDQVFRWRFENVTFALNVVDSLSGDDGYIDIRKRKPKYSTLTVIEKQSEVAREKEQEEKKRYDDEYSKASKEAETQSKEVAKKFLDAQEAIREREAKGEVVDLKEREAVEIRAVVQSQLTQQKLEIEKDRLKRERDDRIKESGRRLDQQIDQIQDSFKVWAVSLPLIPPLFVGLAVFVRRRLREREGISKTRLV